MSYKSSYDSEFCGNLPLHNINLVQPYGFLIILDKNAHKIIQVSENIEQLLNVNFSIVLNQPVVNILNPECVKQFNEKIAESEGRKFPLKLKLNTHFTGRDILVLISSQPDYYLLEIEIEEASDSFIDVFQHIKYSMTLIDRLSTLTDVCNVTATELKKITGFDKVMIYQFDEDWNGLVVAEAKEEAMESYLGLKFPASDIPRQARELYIKNPYRFIPDASYTPVKVIPVLNPITNAFVDLTGINLRSVAAVHLEYLANMNVAASMSVRIMKDDKLWGLVSCHHRSAKKINYQLCSVLELLSNFISSKINSVINRESFEQLSNLLKVRNELINKVYSTTNISAALLAEGASLLGFLNAEGITITIKGDVQSIGVVPDSADIEEIIYWVQTKERRNVFTENNIAGSLERASDYAKVASGIIVLPVNNERGDYIIGYRPEVIKTVNWGGNPNEAIRFEPDKKNYHPRNSFKIWQQEVTKTARPWTLQELDVAESFRSFLAEYTSRYLYN